MRLILCTCCLIFFFACKENNVPLYKETGIKASIEVDDSTLHLHNNFTVALEGTTQKIACRIVNDTVFVPNNLKDSIYKIKFSYRNLNLAFDRIHKFDLLPTQSVHWEFGVDNQPFNLLRGAIYSEDIKPGLYSKVEFLIMNPQEKGCGLLFANKIE